MIAVVAHRQPSRRAAGVRRRRCVDEDAAGPRAAARAHPDRLGARASCCRRSRPSWASRRGAPWCAGSPTCTPPWSASGRSRRTRPTSPSRPRRGWARACRSSGPTSCTRSRPCPGSTRSILWWATTRRPAEPRCTGCANRSSRRTTACSAAAAASARAARPTEALAPSFEDLLSLAGRAAAGCEGLLFTPWLNGERSPVEDKVVRAGWLNLSLRTDRAMLVRSVLEGVAYNSRWLLRCLREVPQAARPQGPHPGRRRPERPVVPDLRRRPRAPGRAGGRPAARAAERRGPVGPGLPRRADPRRDAGARAVAATFTPSSHDRALRRAGTPSTASSTAAQGALPPAEREVRDVLMMAQSPDSGEACRPAGA